MTHAFSLHDWMQQHQHRVEHALQQQLKAKLLPTSEKLLEAMHYATLNGGKRLRALLVYATAEAFGTDNAAVDAAACAVEMIHAYSLVHDDMPIMDNDDLRRGRPTCHKAYDDATALLVGDALQSLAFEVLCNNALSAKQQVSMVKTLAQAAGVYGMAGGQAIDLESVGKALDLNALQTMHRLKTGALIRASVLLGLMATEQSDKNIEVKLRHYAACIGLAFQVQDDVLDVTADTETLGKKQGADQALNKPTYPALLGLEQAQQKANNLIDEALEQLDALPCDAEILRALAEFVVNRTH